MNFLQNNKLFQKLDPYLRLMRVDKPIGVLLLLWPCLWSVTAAYRAKGFPIKYWFLFTIGAFLMRGAGCILNDIWDRDLDKHVERTKNRPLASGELSIKQALYCLAILLILSFIILIQFNLFSIILGLSSIVLVAIYPLMKRITYIPQLFLGLTFNWGALLGWSAIHGELSVQASLFYIAGIFWTLGYDTIYAHQDREDDEKIGIKSTARLFGDKTQRVIELFYNFTAIMIAIAALLSGFSLVFFVLAMPAAWQLYWQTHKFDIEDKNMCNKLFKSNAIFGAIIFIAMVVDIYISNM